MAHMQKANNDGGNMTVKELQEVLEKLIEGGKGNYKVCAEGFCCGTDRVDVRDEHCEICIT